MVVCAAPFVSGFLYNGPQSWRLEKFSCKRRERDAWIDGEIKNNNDA